MNQTILIIDDDHNLRKMLQLQLERHNYRVFAAANGTEGLKKAYQIQPDLILLDIMMPEMNGWEVCRRLREISKTPILMLTACSVQDDVVKGFEIGADDYITKPYGAQELQARIKAVLRRSEKSGGRGRSAASLYSNRGLHIDFDRRIVEAHEQRVDLTPIEFKLLSCLVRHEGRVLPHRYILTEIWGPEYAEEIEYVKLYIRYLRRKIEENPSKPDYIHTEWGVGYFLSKAPPS